MSTCAPSSKLDPSNVTEKDADKKLKKSPYRDHRLRHDRGWSPRREGDPRAARQAL